MNEKAILLKRLDALETRNQELTKKHAILLELLADLKQDILTLKTVTERINGQMALDAEKQAENG